MSFGHLWTLTQSKDAVRLLCSAPGCEWAVRRGFCQERVSAAWTLTRINSTKWFFFSTRYLQSLSTINSGMWEYKQPAVSQLYGRITFKKLVAMIMLCVFCDPEKGAHSFQWFSISDAGSVVCFYRLVYSLKNWSYSLNLPKTILWASTCFPI